jgi:CheY-like chemotaxis protein
LAVRVLVIHRNAAEAAPREDRLRRAGFLVESLRKSEELPRLRGNPPDAVVIDLTRQPSHGREVGIYLRRQKATRHVPLIFIEGDPERTAQVRSLLPDAVFTTWPRIHAALRRALRNQPEDPAVPGTFAGYSGTPLARKLRIGEGSVVALLAAPKDFPAKLEPLPAGVRFQTERSGASVLLAFVKSRATLERELVVWAQEMREGRTLWLIWPKKTSELAGDLTQAKVRELGLTAGLVDYKVCAVDETWSGLAFAVRRAQRA